ncbi:gamma-type small acid-soluble spore protein [Neobacillus notoginsengisoli]|uniref:Gamma-type small acid-soluble spore protein n=1 Tax=Neobacillus notoginsengisoli TaxID=1578198 RepID=A0A417YS90_9BACI|nr:gamma-type small acid-soluble spore protein [Neobacillus notoginsengisoli]RHW38160.1 gamma-type small acid-soluble spore protein [Neobacillus notoginsengisoli]
MNHNKKNLTSVGTDIEEVKRLNAESGLSYNEVKELLAKTGGKGPAMYSDTYVEDIKRKIQPGGVK